MRPNVFCQGFPILGTAGDACVLIIIESGKLARAFARFLRVFRSHFVPDPTQGK